jgi:hypothetical protein
MHLLIWFDDASKIRTPSEVDSLVSAQLPDKETHPRLYELVTSKMLHGPCGPGFPNAPCMVDGKCSKNFPKEFCEHTSVGEDGYPKYARPDNGRVYVTKDFTYDNRWVVPHCPLILLLLMCHINVELTFNIRAIKYIHKYIYKGHDRTTMEFGKDIDEIKQYLDARYIGAPEAVW